jgi:hypothetical protein
MLDNHVKAALRAHAGKFPAWEFLHRELRSRGNNREKRICLMVREPVWVHYDQD